MAPRPEEAPTWADDHLLVKPEAEQQLNPSEIWYHLGGWWDEGDTYETQRFQFERELDCFWTSLLGPDEQLRRNLLEALAGITPEWESVQIHANGKVLLRFADRTAKTIAPPKSPR